MGPRSFYVSKPSAVRSMPELFFWASVMSWLPFELLGTGYVVEGLMVFLIRCSCGPRSPTQCTTNKYQRINVHVHAYNRQNYLSRLKTQTRFISVIFALRLECNSMQFDKEIYVHICTPDHMGVVPQKSRLCGENCIGAPGCHTHWRLLSTSVSYHCIIWCINL
jgi:hypothetical protein